VCAPAVLNLAAATKGLRGADGFRVFDFMRSPIGEA
jgi:hypothetical protein